MNSSVLDKPFQVLFASEEILVNKQDFRVVDIQSLLGGGVVTGKGFRTASTAMQGFGLKKIQNHLSP